MRLAWCTPLDVRSGISKFSATVLPHLAALADVEVFAPTSGQAYGTGLPVHSLDGNRGSDLASFDAVVYNVGNNVAFHVEIQRALERVPGIVVVHDKRLHGFFRELWAVVDSDPARYAAMMRYYYGQTGEAFAADVLAGRAGVDSTTDYPLVEPVLWNATGIVVHSREAAAWVARYGDLVPVRTLGLPFDPVFLGGLGAPPERSNLVPADGRVLLVSSGLVSEHKRLESVMNAVAGDPVLRDSVRFAIVGGGPADYLARLGFLARDLGIEDTVDITGRVSDSDMYGWIAAADIAVNLRYPSIESSSLSLVEQMYLGKPLVVTDTSYFAELPDDVAIKIPVADETVKLPAALRDLVSDPIRRTQMGAAARALAERAHSPVVYAQGVVELARTAREGSGGIR